MKLAVSSISSTARRSPPREIRGTAAVAVLPTVLARRSSILFVSLMVGSGGLKFAEDDTDQLAFGAAEFGDDIFHAVVDVEVCRQHRDEAVGGIEQGAIGHAPGRLRSVENHQIVAAGGTCLRDRLADGAACLDIGSLDTGSLDRRQD